MIYKFVIRLFAFLLFVLFILFFFKNYYLSALVDTLEKNIVKRNDNISDISISNFHILSPSRVNIEEILIVLTNSGSIVSREVTLSDLNPFSFFIDPNKFYSNLNLRISDLYSDSGNNRYQIKNLSKIDGELNLDLDFIVSNNKYKIDNLKVSSDNIHSVQYSNLESLIDEVVNFSNIHFDDAMFSINDQIFEISGGDIICNGTDNCSYHLDSLYTSHEMSGDILLPLVKGAFILNNHQHIITLTSINNDIYIDGIKYNFNLKISLHRNNSIIYIDYINISKKAEDFTFIGELDMKFSWMTGEVETTSMKFPFVDFVPGSSSLIINSAKDLYNYEINFDLYDVENLSSIAFDHISGSLDIIIESFSPFQYQIDFDPDILVSDSAYNGTVAIKEFDNFDDIEIEVVNKFIKLLDIKKLNN